METLGSDGWEEKLYATHPWQTHEIRLFDDKAGYLFDL